MADVATQFERFCTAALSREKAGGIEINDRVNIFMRLLIDLFISYSPETFGEFTDLLK